MTNNNNNNNDSDNDFRQGIGHFNQDNGENVMQIVNTGPIFVLNKYKFRYSL